MNKRSLILICLLALPACFSGCAASRLVSDVAMGGGGALIANKLSNGDPIMTAVGAAGGVAVSEGIHMAAKSQADKAYANGYQKGRSDAVKQQYWVLINQQKERATQTEDSVRYYEIPLPEQKVDGVILQPTTKYLRIEE